MKNIITLLVCSFLLFGQNESEKFDVKVIYRSKVTGDTLWHTHNIGTETPEYKVIGQVLKGLMPNEEYIVTLKNGDFIFSDTVNFAENPDSIVVRYWDPGCEFDANDAIEDIKEGNPKFYFSGGLILEEPAPEVLALLKKYNIEYVDVSPEEYYFDCYKSYHFEIFKYLDSKYGDEWREELKNIGIKALDEYLIKN